MSAALASLVNGVAQDTVALADRGLQYGDGLFETIRFSNSNLLLWQRHYRRLVLGCERLAIPAPAADLLLQDIAQLTTAISDGIIKIVLTRGVGGRGYRIAPDAAPTRAVMLFSTPVYPSHYAEQGVNVRICDLRLARQPLLAGIKHLNRLEQILARAEWSDDDIAEGLLLDSNERVIEATMSNLFVVLDGKLVTPIIDFAGVAGVARAAIVDFARSQHMPCAEMDLGLEQLAQADEIFLCNSVNGIWPVRQLAQRQLAIGPITRMLQANEQAIFRGA